MIKFYIDTTLYIGNRIDKRKELGTFRYEINDSFIDIGILNESVFITPVITHMPIEVYYQTKLIPADIPQPKAINSDIDYRALLKAYLVRVEDRVSFIANRHHDTVQFTDAEISTLQNLVDEINGN